MERGYARAGWAVNGPRALDRAASHRANFPGWKRVRENPRPRARVAAEEGASRVGVAARGRRLLRSPARRLLAGLVHRRRDRLTLVTGLLLLERRPGLLPVLLEPDDPGVGQRMPDHLLEDLERQRRDVGAGEGRIRHVPRVPDRRREHFRVVLEEADDLGQLADDRQPFLVDIIEAADERREQRGAGLRREESLVRAEDQGAVGLDAFGLEPAHRLEAVLG